MIYSRLLRDDAAGNKTLKGAADVLALSPSLSSLDGGFVMVLGLHPLPQFTISKSDE
jgi:hypothetical protein